MLEITGKFGDICQQQIQVIISRHRCTFHTTCIRIRVDICHFATCQ